MTYCSHSSASTSGNDHSSKTYSQCEVAEICESVGGQGDLKDLTASEAGNSTKANANINGDSFIGNLLACKPVLLEENTSGQNSIIRLPRHDEPFMVLDYSVTLSCLKLQRKHDQSDAYFPISNWLQNGLHPHLVDYTFLLAENADGDLFLFPSTDTGSELSKELSKVVQAAGHQPVIMQTFFEHIVGTEPVDIEINTNVPFKAFERLIEEAFSGYIIDDLDHPVIDRVLSDELGEGGDE